MDSCCRLQAGLDFEANRVVHQHVQCLLQVMRRMTPPCSAPSANGKTQWGWQPREAFLWDMHPQKEKAAS